MSAGDGLNMYVSTKPKKSVSRIAKSFFKMTGMMMLFVLVLDLLVLDETFPSVLLVYKAQQLRYETGNWALHAKHEEWNVTISSLAHKYLVRPFQLLVTPILFFMSLYAAFVYGIVYLSVTFPPSYHFGLTNHIIMA